MTSRACADERLLRAAVREEDHGRNREHVIPGGDLRVVVDVDPGELDPACGLALELLEDRPDRLARPAPRRPEVDDERPFGANGLVELTKRAGSLTRSWRLHSLMRTTELRSGNLELS